MTTFRHKMQRIGNQIGVWMYRVSDGRLASHSKNITVLMITARGRRTGVLHSTCVRYLDTADGFLVWGTASGAPRDPDWFRNLRHAPYADVQVRARHFRVRPRELLGAERDTTWREVVLTQAPQVQRYARRAGRTIPVAVLVPTDADRPQEAHHSRPAERRPANNSSLPS